MKNDRVPNESKKEGQQQQQQQQRPARGEAILQTDCLWCCTLLLQLTEVECDRLQTRRE